MESSNNIDEKPAEPTRPRIAGVPRQYSVGTLLLITAMYAVLFSLLRCMQASEIVFALVAAFLTCVGLGQAILFKGKSPQAASIVAGVVFWGLLAIGLLGWIFLESGSFLFWEEVLPIIATAVVFGGILGYFTGSAIAMVFLVAQEINRPLAARRLRIERENEVEDSSVRRDAP